MSQVKELTLDLQEIYTFIEISEKYAFLYVFH